MISILSPIQTIAYYQCKLMCALFASNIGYCRHRLTLITHWKQNPKLKHNMVRLIMMLAALQVHGL